MRHRAALGRQETVVSLLFLALLGILAALKICRDVDHDIFWQLADGRAVVEERALPVVERFSFTAAGKPMVATEWLAETASYLVFRAAGFAGLAAYGACLFTATFAAMLALLRRRMSLLESLSLLSLIAFGFLNVFAVRAQNWTFLFTALFLYWAALWEDGAVWAPWAMAGGLLFWVNLHGGFMVGWAILALVCTRAAWDSRRLEVLAPLGLGTALCFVHPNGATAFVYPLWFMVFPPAGRAVIQEWRPVDFSQANAAPYLLVFALLLWVGIGSARGRFPWGGLTLALTLLALRGRKLMPEFCLAAAAFIAVKLGAVPEKRRRGVLAAGAAALGGTLWVVLSRAGGCSLDIERAFPRAAVELIDARFAGRPLFHDYDWGGYLIYKLFPRTKVFIDGRLDPYWSLLPGDYATIIEEKPGWREKLEAYGIRAVLIRPTDRLGEGLSRDPAWRLEYSDARSVLFVR